MNHFKPLNLNAHRITDEMFIWYSFLIYQSLKFSTFNSDCFPKLFLSWFSSEHSNVFYTVRKQEICPFQETVSYEIFYFHYLSNESMNYLLINVIFMCLINRA